MTAELIPGCMFSGKTDAMMIRVLELAEGRKILLVKHVWDKRYKPERHLCTHNGKSMKAFRSRSVDDLYMVAEIFQPSVLGIDEVEFYDERILRFVADYTPFIHIILSGLNLDFRKEPFPFRDSSDFGKDSIYTMADLAKLVDFVHKPLEYICMYETTTEPLSGCVKVISCGKPAPYTQRLFADGTPVPYSDPTIVVGNSNPNQTEKVKGTKRIYQSRCLEHHIIDRPQI